MQFKLPELGEGVHEGELVKWNVKTGDQVKEDQSLCEVMTDKATIEIPSPFHGTIQEIHVKEGAVVKVGQLMISFVGGSANASKSAQVAAPAEPTPSTPQAAPKSSVVSVPAPMMASPMASSDHSRATAAPAVRKMAHAAGVELGSVQGSGPQGRVMKEDLDRFLSSGGSRGGSVVSGGLMTPSRLTPSIPGGELRVPFKGLRKKIAEKMRQSKDHAAHFTYVEEADVSRLVKLREEAKEIGGKQGVKVTYLPFIMKAMVATLRQFPVLNSSLDEEKGELVYKHYYNIALSVQTDDGLMAPVVKDIEHKSILEIARDIQALVDRARNKKLTMEDLKGGTITLTNAGTIGGLFATPVINYPEVAILGFNKIFRKPVVKVVKGQEKIVIRDWTYFSLSLDHRVVDGAVGAEFMKAFIQYIENPSLLLMDAI